MPTRDINDLTPSFKEKADAFFLRMKERGMEMAAHDVLRTEEEQRQNVEKGASKTMDSKHLKGLAFDAHFVKYPNFPGEPRGIESVYSLTKGQAVSKDRYLELYDQCINKCTDDNPWVIASKEAWKVGIITGTFMWNWDHNHFEDCDKPLREKPPTWAEEAVSWGVENGITNGERLLDPITRAEAIVMIHRARKCCSCSS